MPENHRTSLTPGSKLAALGTLLSLAIVVLFLVDLRGRYFDRIAAAKTDAQSFANVLAEHTVLTFDDIDRALLEAETIRQKTSSGKDNAAGAANPALRQLVKSSPVVIAVGWTDTLGDVLAHSSGQDLSGRNLSDVSHFTVHRDRADYGLFISLPFRSAISGKWLTTTSRRLNNADGSFAGIVTAPIDQSYFTKIYRSIDLGQSGSVALLHREGRMLAREPQNDDALGRSYAGWATADQASSGI